MNLCKEGEVIDCTLFVISLLDIKEKERTIVDKEEFYHDDLRCYKYFG